jgi:hypothetical protein
VVIETTIFYGGDVHDFRQTRAINAFSPKLFQRCLDNPLACASFGIVFVAHGEIVGVDVKHHGFG